MARTASDYDLSAATPRKKIEAPELPYEPRDPKSYQPEIGLIGCGGITASHLTAYRKAGYHVVALCDVERARAESRAAEYFPGAAVYTEATDLLKRDDIEVVDIATHPNHRAPLIEAAIEAGKHVLSQKPFVTDLDLGEKLVEMAKSRGVHLAVNQNGRWAPHFSYARQAILAGLLGDMIAAHLSVHWDHNWIIDTPFNEVRHIVLYDFAIHWFDIVTQFMGEQTPTRVYASN
ncbi:MAG: Gfo/Idh/MocA family oxidoreductase, partial [Chloroflexi bacterium]|nr:Gfo/Idh/MocA family oxidoreductase [Chloroflexota bacterium]